MAGLRAIGGGSRAHIVWHLPRSAHPSGDQELPAATAQGLAYAIGFAFLAGVLPRAQAAGMNRGLVEEYFEKLVQ